MKLLLQTSPGLVCKRWIPLVLFLVFGSVLSAQPWLSNLKNEESPNFFEIQRAFNDFWAGKKVEKGKGIKTFRRWEWYWERRVDAQGNFPPAAAPMLAWQDYLRTQKDGGVEKVLAPGNWTSLGPNTTDGGYEGVGRINCIAFHPTNTSTFWVGAASGGLWKTTNGGTTWTPMTDNQVVLGVSDIVIDNSNSNTMYLATGDGDAGDTYSVGVLKSTDGGTTWNTTGLLWSVSNFRVIRRMVQHNSNPSILLVASSAGIWRTTDAGANWTQVFSGSFYDLEKNPSDPNIIYASTGTRVYRSTDGGVNWTQTLLLSSAGRIALAVSPANSAFVGALAARSDNSGYLGFYASTDSGANFTLKSSTPNLLGYSSTGSDTGGQGWYDLCVAADPTNANTIYVGGVNTWKSTNGGTSWTLNTMWYQITGVPTAHADKHSLFFQNNSTLFQTNDGGVYRTTNGGSTWTDISVGLAISQMYRLGVSQANSAVIAGLQDNGTKFRSNSGTWSDHIGGDGMECIIDPTTASVMYGELYNGEIYRTTNTGGSWTNISQNITGQPSGAWVTPYVLDPNNNMTIYAGYKDVYRSTNRGNSWTKISTNLVTGSNYIQSLAVAPSNSSVIYAASYAALFKTTNGGTSWSQLTATPITGSLTYIAIDPTDANKVWVVMSNYTSGQKVFSSTNGGTSWTNISGTLPNLPANCIVYQNGSNGGVYVGMDVGVYYRDNSLTDWVLFNGSLPNVVVSELEIQYATGKIKAATFGRGLWESDLYTGAAVTCTAPLANQLSATNVTNSAARLNCSVTGVDEYGWRYRQNGSSTWITPSSTTVAFQDISGLSSGTTYEFQTQVRCGTTWSDWSPSQTFTTTTVSSGCASAFPLSCGTVYNSTTVGGATAFSSYSCAVWNESGPEKVHTVQTTVAGDLTASLSGLSSDLDVFILSSCDPNTCLASGDVTATATNVAPGTYYIIVDGRNGASGSYSLEVGCPSTCPAPTLAQLGVSSITETSARLTCSATGVDEYGFRYRPVGSSTWTGPIFTTFFIYSAQNLNSGTNYEFQVQVRCGSTWSAWSVSKTFSTLGGASCNAPGQSQLSASNITTTTARLNCSLGGVDEYAWRYRTVGASTWQTPANTTVNFQDIASLSAGTNYEFQVQVRCGTLWSVWSVSQTFTTQSAASCNPPSTAQLSASSITTSSAQLNCTLTGVDEYGWQYRAVGSSTWTSGGTTLVNSKSLSGLSAATNYEFQVQVRCGSTWSIWSGSQTFTTQSAATCNAPTVSQLSATNITTSGAQLNCSAGSVAEFAWRYRMVGTATWTNAPNTATGVQIISGLAASTDYEFQVQVRCGSIWSAWSGSQTFTTGALGGTPPANDEPCNAVTLTVVTLCDSLLYNNINATGTTNPVPSASCPSANAKDVWFKAQIPNNFRLTVQLIPGTLTDAVMAFYTGSSCTALTEVVCENDDSPNNLMPIITFVGQPGTLVHIRVWGNNGTTGTFRICAINYTPSPIANPDNHNHWVTTEQGFTTLVGDGETGAVLAGQSLEDLQDYANAPLAMKLYPQPADQKVMISAPIKAPCDVQIGFYDLSGALVKQLFRKQENAGLLLEEVSIQDLRPGIYAVGVTACGERAVERLVIVRGGN